MLDYTFVYFIELRTQQLTASCKNWGGKSCVTEYPVLLGHFCASV